MSAITTATRLIQGSRLASGSPGCMYMIITTLVLEFMKKLVAGRYHPAVQINAMLMIGELNSVESPPTPLPDALNELLAAAGDTKLSTAVRVAAMVGVERHVTARIGDEELRRNVAAAVLKAAAAEGPGDAGHQWIIAQAIETLARFNSVGDDNAVFKLMAKTLADNKLSLSTRSIAADSLGRLNYSAATGINAADTAAVLGQFLVDACVEELRLAKSTGKGVSRRRMKQQLEAALTALTGDGENRKGIASLARDAGQQALVRDLQKEIKALTDVLDNLQSNPDDLKGQVGELRDKLETRLKSKA